jgi:hypothetical protein
MKVTSPRIIAKMHVCILLSNNTPIFCKILNCINLSQVCPMHFSFWNGLLVLCSTPMLMLTLTQYNVLFCIIVLVMKASTSFCYRNTFITNTMKSFDALNTFIGIQRISRYQKLHGESHSIH